MKYAIVIEKTDSNFSAYVPDLTGCVATGATPDETEKEIGEAIEFHIEGMKEDGEAIPIPSSSVDYAEVAAFISFKFVLGLRYSTGYKNATNFYAT